MLHRPLGRCGLQVPVLGLAAGPDFGQALGRGGARRRVGQAFDAGIRLFDSAGAAAGGEAERLLGDVLADLRLPREGILLCSRAGAGAASASPLQRGLSRKPLRDACDAALRRLRVDYLDLFLGEQADPDTPIEETVAAMEQLVGAGKVLHWGVGAWPAAALAELARVAAVPGRAAASFVLAERLPEAGPASSRFGWICPWPLAGVSTDPARVARDLAERLTEPQLGCLLLDAGTADAPSIALTALEALFAKASEEGA